MPISLWKRFSYASGMVAVVAIAGGVYSATVQAGPNVRTVQLRDNCDPATFDAAVGPGACVGKGNTLFPDFIAQVFAEGSADKWVMKPDKSEADSGANAQNRGGETHSFTEVDHFGGGIVAVLNLGVPPVDECALKNNGVPVDDGTGSGNFVPLDPQTFIPPGATGATHPLTKGVHKFQCCIHPWMQTTITVK